MVDYYADKLSVFAMYVNNDKYISFQQMPYDKFKENFDNECSNVEYYTDNLGQEYLIHKTESEYCIVLNNGIIQIISNLDKDEVVNLCKNTKVK